MNLKAALTKRESQIAEMLAWGAAKKQIAWSLKISVDTVVNHARNIYAKARVNSIGALSAWWFCKKYGISPALNPLTALCFSLVLLIGISNAKALRCRSKELESTNQTYTL